MNPILRNLIAFVAGGMIGGIVNISIVMIGHQVFEPPFDINNSDFESIKKNAHLLESRDFVFPLIAHAMGVLTGAFIAASVAVSHRMKLAIGIGFLFMIGGTIMITIVGGPLWFLILDLGFAYIPAGILGGFLGITCMNNYGKPVIIDPPTKKNSTKNNEDE